MSDLNVRSESVDVEQIMRQIRARIREKRGSDYTETELKQLASVKLEKFLDPRGIRSDLLQHFQQRQAEETPPNFQFESDTLFESHRPLVRAFRSLFRPLLKLFINVDKLSHTLHLQAKVNANAQARLARVDDLTYELLHNMTLEITRLGVEVHNLKMRVESLTSRLDFDERRTKAFESVVQYKPAARPAPASGAPAGEDAGSTEGRSSGDEATGERRRRRRRRRRRPGGTLAENEQQAATGDSDDGPDDEGTEATPAEPAAGSEPASNDAPESESDR